MQASDVPIVRLFIPSEDDEQTLVNLAELIGVEMEGQTDVNQAEPPTAGCVRFMLLCLICIAVVNQLCLYMVHFQYFQYIFDILEPLSFNGVIEPLCIT